MNARLAKFGILTVMTLFSLASSHAWAEIYGMYRVDQETHIKLTSSGVSESKINITIETSNSDPAPKNLMVSSFLYGLVFSANGAVTQTADKILSLYLFDTAGVNGFTRKQARKLKSPVFKAVSQSQDGHSIISKYEVDLTKISGYRPGQSLKVFFQSVPVPDQISFMESVGSRVIESRELVSDGVSRTLIDTKSDYFVKLSDILSRMNSSRDSQRELFALAVPETIAEKTLFTSEMANKYVQWMLTYGAHVPGIARHFSYILPHSTVEDNVRFLNFFSIQNDYRNKYGEVQLEFARQLVDRLLPLTDKVLKSDFYSYPVGMILVGVLGKYPALSKDSGEIDRLQNKVMEWMTKAAMGTLNENPAPLNCSGIFQ